MSARQGILEAVKGLVGVYPLRCRRCRHRWLTSAWEDGAWRFARCPRCYRQELTTWSEQYYHPSRWITILLRMGAIPYRCAACRCNFASFKPCKEKFSWRHETKVMPKKGAPLEEVGVTGISGPAGHRNGLAAHAPLVQKHEPTSRTTVQTHVGEEQTEERLEEESPEPYL